MDQLRDQLQTSLGHAYTLERELGGGGMSRVFVAEETRFRRRVVVKVLSPELAAGLSAERFEREVMLAAALQEPHIVPVHAAGTTADGLPWYTMPFVDGESLRARLAQGRMPLGEAVSILRDVARALAHAHAHGVVHRDIKPENVLLSGRTAVVTDFGIAKAVRASATAAPGGTLTEIGTSLGTPAYLSPEQAVGDDVDQRADLYAWGVMAYELLAGQHPFATKTNARQLVAAHIAEEPPPLATSTSGVPNALATLVMRCLAKDRERRPASAQAMFAVLDDPALLMTHEESAARAAAASVPGAARDARRRRRLALAGVGLLALAAGLAAMQRERVAALLGGAHAPAAARVDGTPSIAVLPFTNLGGDTAQQYFADGMTEEVSGVLAKIPTLRVAGRRSAFAFVGSRATPREIGQALGVATLLEGTVRRAGDRMRVTAELTNAADGMRRQSWSWDRPAADAFRVQDEIAQAIAAELRLTLGGAALAAARAGRTASPAAHDLYLRGRAELNGGTEPAIRRAIALFRQALAADSGYARAYAGIATAYAVLADVYVPAREAYPLVRDAALEALRRDSLLADARAAYGYALLTAERAIARGAREMERAVALDPNSFDAAFFYSNYLCASARNDDAVVYAARSLTLEPLSAMASWNRELCLYMGRRWDDVLAQHQRTRQLDSTLVYIDAFDGAALREKGQYDQAVAAYEHAQRLLGGQPLYGLAITYARMGRLEEARRVMRDLEAYARRAYVIPDALALGYAGIGDRERAFAWLERAYEARSLPLLGLRAFPEYDSLRTDPRYDALVRKIGFP